ncbi:hypothetical protein [Klebsiella pneumoniae]|uniref:hypothetical protein n=1 Tax=Klebsiella pneumoniae TaxID=573 RepID=UPI000D1A22B4|nr:hypothetical protein [Klebsiella pneumoniae]
MAKSRKKKPVKKPSYTKLHGYAYVNDIVKRSPKLLAQAADVVVRFDLLKQDQLSMGEILKGKEQIKIILEKAPNIRQMLDTLKEGFEKLIASPGKKDEEHFAALVGLGAEFIAAMTEDVIAPMAEIAEIVEKRTANKEPVNV